MPALLVNRYRVERDRVSERSRVIDAVDELSAGSRRVRLVLVRAPEAKALEDALRRAQRYAIGVSGHAELIAVFELEPGHQAVAFACPDGRALDEATEPLDERRGERLRGDLERALAPLHGQGMAHGYVCPELVFERSDGGAVLLGFGLAQAVRALGLPADAVLVSSAAVPPSPANDAAAVLGLFSLASAPERPGQPSSSEEVQQLAPAPAVAPLLPPASPAPVSAPPSASPSPVSVPPADLRARVEPRAARERAQVPPPSDSLPARRSIAAWVALALGALSMVGGVAAAFVYARGTAPAAPSALPTPALPSLPPHAPPAVLPAPAPAPSLGAADGGAPDATDDTRGGAPELSPPVHARPPAAHADAALPVDESQPTWGPWDAALTLTLFADLSCPHTRAALGELVHLKSELGNDLRWVFRHRPLSQNAESRRAAELMAGIAQKLGPGVFWKLVTELSNDVQTSPVQLIEAWLTRSGVDASTRASLTLGPEVSRAVDVDLELGARLLVRASPTSFVNGVRVEGFRSEEALLEELRRERRASLFTLLDGVEPEAVYGERTLRNLVNLGEDPDERACVPSLGGPTRGASDAPVTIVQYCAFESSYCQQAEGPLRALLARHPRDVRMVWKSYPTSQDGEGRLAANVALAARSAGGEPAFWAAHRALLEGRAVLENKELAAALGKLGLSVDSLVEQARAGAHDAHIDADVELGKKLGVSGVPTYFVNGTRKDGLLTLNELEAVVKSELALARRLKDLGRGRIEDLACRALGR